MRIDKFLKVSRLIKRRTVANQACDGERISVNGRQVKPSYQVKLVDVIEIAYGQRTLKVEVTALTDLPFSNLNSLATSNQPLKVA